MAKTLWPKSSSVRVARSLAAHSVLGLAIGGLIYILALTGTLSVFNKEFQRWEQPSAPEMTQISPAAAERAARTVFESEETPTTHLYINLPQPDLPRTVITTDTQAFFASETGEIAGVERFPWTQFLLDLHYYLHLPHTFGIMFVGALGACLVAMSISGLLAHPRIFRDAFTFRRGEGRLPLTDIHNRLSVWTAPFHLSNALTGAILGLATILAFAIASVSFDGDTSKVFSPVFGSEAAPNEAPAQIGEIAKPLAYMSESFPEVLPGYFILHDPGTAGQHVNVIARHTDRLIFGEYYNFDANGDFQGTTGLADGTLGQQIAGSIYNVHFGNWGGLPVKLAYLVFGLSLSLIIASGLQIYFARRREKGRAAPRLEAGWSGIVWGTPAALAFCLLLSVAGVVAETALVAAFWGLLCAAIIASLCGGQARLCGFVLRAVTALLLVLAVGLHASVHRTAIGQVSMLPVSLTLLGVAGLLCIDLARSKVRERQQQVSLVSS